MLAVPNEDKRLLTWVNRRSLTTAEMGARRLRRKNAKALRLGLEQSTSEITERAAIAMKLKRHQYCVIRRSMGYIVSSSDVSYGSDDHLLPRTPTTMSMTERAKAQRESDEEARLSVFYLLSLVILV